MRDLPVIWDAWLNQNGKMVGDYAPHGVVTLQEDWLLKKSARKVGISKRGPFRWWQRADNGQTETELPNVLRIDIDRSIDTDAGQCTIELSNTSLDAGDQVPAAFQRRIGAAGYYSWARGKSKAAIARWGHETNDWEDVIRPNALLRTYQGYGGRTKDWEDARDDGNIALTGVWLVDEVTVNSRGNISLSCRDMAKLLIEQKLYKPLVPAHEYPDGLRFCRWYYEQFDASFKARRPGIAKGKPYGDNAPRVIIPLTYRHSSADAWYGFDAEVHGHKGSHSVDGSRDTFSLSPGSSHPDRDFAADFWEFDLSGQVDKIYVEPWGGNYEMYISIFENGRWHTNGEGVIRYDHSGLCATQDCVDTGADIPFVVRTGVAWDEGRWYQLGRTYSPSKVRITFRNHTQSEWGPWYYRCGIRDVRAGYGDPKPLPTTNGRDDHLEGTLGGGVDDLPWVYAFEHHPKTTGYWCVDETGRVFAFGDCQEYEQNEGGPHDVVAVGIRATATGRGYYVLLGNGRVQSYGDAVWYGSGSSIDYIDMAITNTGAGYYLVQRDGTVEAFGDATHYGNMPVLSPLGSGDGGYSDIEAYTAVSIDTHPTLDGYWVVNGNGHVRAFGSVSSHGQVNNRSGLEEQEWVTALRANATGNGYWMIGGSGKVYAFGGTSHLGQFEAEEEFRPIEEAFRLQTYGFTANPSGEGYALQHANGEISFYGNFDYWGHPGGEGTRRTDGNYLDFVDIVKRIALWSGFWLYRSSPPTGEEPELYGRLEYTGAYSEECLPEDQFDKQAPIDGINLVKEAVGYLVYVDDEGGFNFVAPNWWQSGNFYLDGTWTDYIPEIDENVNATEYKVNFSAADARSSITISTDQPDKGGKTTVTTKYVPKTADILHGMVNPAIWTNGAFANPAEQRIMAELISMHIWFSMRRGSVTCLANPAIGLNDQVRIFEETTAETYIHFVRGVSTSYDADAGTYMMTLETNWLGDDESWVITKENIPDGVDGIQVSEELQAWIENMLSHPTTIARLAEYSGVSIIPEVGQAFAGAAIPIGTPGQANG